MKKDISPILVCQIQGFMCNILHQSNILTSKGNAQHLFAAQNIQQLWVPKVKWRSYEKKECELVACGGQLERVKGGTNHSCLRMGFYKPDKYSDDWFDMNFQECFNNRRYFIHLIDYSSLKVGENLNH